MIDRIFAALMAIGALSLGGCATPPGDDAVPALKVTAPSGESSVIIGSVHVGVEGLREPDVNVLFKNARVYVTESVPDDGPKAEPRKLRMGMLKDNQLVRARWASGLTPVELQTFEERLACNLGAALPPKVSASEAAFIMLSMGDPVSALEVAVRRCAPSGIVSRDALLAEAAAARGLSTVGLERPIDVEAQRLSVSDDVYAELLKMALRPSNELDMQRLVDALNLADYDAILQVMTAPVPAEMARQYLDPMLNERNRAWMGRLTEILKTGGAVINVGAGHLGGAQGLVALLRGGGYTVDAVYLPARKPGDQAGSTSIKAAAR